MYDFMIGEITKVNKNNISLLVGGIGYKVFCPERTTQTLILNDKYKIFLSLVIRENLNALYGFGSSQDRDSFEMFLSANGVGPKLALDLLSTYSSNDLEQYIASEDLTALTKISGLGVKKAKKLVLECKDKIGKIEIDLVERTNPLIEEEIITGLQSLGYGKREIINKIRESNKKYDNVKDGIRDLLEILSSS